MPGYKKSSAFIVAPLLLIAVIAGCGSEPKPGVGKIDSATQAEISTRDSLNIELAGADGSTVLDLLKASHEVDYRSSVVGAFVTRVDKVEIGSEYFWVFSVNDSLPNTACDKYVTSDGDRVVWHFRRMRR